MEHRIHTADNLCPRIQRLLGPRSPVPLSGDAWQLSGLGGTQNCVCGCILVCILSTTGLIDGRDEAVPRSLEIGSLDCKDGDKGGALASGLLMASGIREDAGAKVGPEN